MILGKFLSLQASIFLALSNIGMVLRIERKNMQSALYCSWHILNAQMLVLLFGSTKLEPGQRFPTRGVIVLLTGHLSMSEDIFDCYKRGREYYYNSIQWARGRGCY